MGLAVLCGKALFWWLKEMWNTPPMWKRY